MVHPWRGVSAPAPPRQYRRLAVFVVGLGLVLGAMIFRLVEIQLVQAEELRAEVDERRTRQKVWPHLRGRILDRNGRVLAYSTFVKEVIADPSKVGPRYAEFLAQRLAGPLEMDPERLCRLLASDVRTNDAGRVVPDQYALLKKGVMREDWERVRAVLDDLKDLPEDPRLDSRQSKAMASVVKRLCGAIMTEPRDRQIRIYPSGETACQVVGFVGQNPEFEERSTEPLLIGVEGLEAELDPWLQGVPSFTTQRLVWRGGQKFYTTVETVRGRSGMDVMLTLDLRVQAIVEEELAAGYREYLPKGICCVIISPASGEVLALGNLPNFDPNRVGESTPEGRRNRSVTDSFEPGSTFKALSIAAALESKVIALEDRIYCEMGQYRVRKRWLHDLHPYGVLTVEQVLVKSSNIGAAKVAQALGELRLYDVLHRFGIGRKTGIPLPAETAGTLHPLSQWEPESSILSVPMGHEVAASPLQMTMAFAALANGGVLMRPMLVKQVTGSGGEVLSVFEPSERGRAVSERVARQMTQALRAVVEAPGGTGGRARLERYTVAGKTGTAEKRGAWGAGHFASFIGYLPAEKPRLCIGVFVDEPRGGTHYGGTTAAPVFQSIARRAAAVLGIPPSAVPVVNPELESRSLVRLTRVTPRANM